MEHTSAPTPIARTLARVAVATVGILLVGAGIAMGKFSTTGASPISCIPAALTYVAGQAGLEWLTLGRLTLLLNVLLFLAEVALLRRDFSPIQVLQIPWLMLMTSSVDLWLSLFEAVLPNDALLMHYVWLAVSIAVMSLGVFLEVSANVLMIPGEAIVVVISYVSGRAFATCKTAFDLTLCAGGAILSLALTGGLVGAREGTLANAALVGPLTRIWKSLFPTIVERLGAAEPLVGSVVPPSGN